MVRQVELQEGVLEEELQEGLLQEKVEQAGAQQVEIDIILVVMTLMRQITSADQTNLR